MRKLNLAVAAAVISLTLAGQPAFAQNGQQTASVTTSDTRCVERIGFKGRWHQGVDSKWHRCRRTAGGFWVIGRSKGFFGAAGIPVAAAATAGVAAAALSSGSSNPASN